MPFQKASQSPFTSDPIAQRLLHETTILCEPGSRAEAFRAALTSAAERLAGSANAVDRMTINTAQQRLMAIAESCAHDPLRFFDAAALASETDFWDPRADRVSLLTLHASKGLEFPVVFIVGCEDGVLPFYWGEADASTMAEERRLAYVGMTRAKDRLILSRALRRHWRGTLRRLEASPFFADIEKELVKQQTAAPRTRRADPQLKLIRPRVACRILGTEANPVTGTQEFVRAERP
jgi:hypothetical protein